MRGNSERWQPLQRASVLRASAQAGRPAPLGRTSSEGCAWRVLMEAFFHRLRGDGSVMATAAAVAVVEMVGPGGAEALFAVAAAGNLGG
jgi:hypothetical protein